MKQIIDIENWHRRNNFNFFRGFINPTISVTSEVECAGARRRAKEHGQSFFIHYLYAIVRACNEVEEFRYRIDSEGQIMLFEKVDVIAPIKVNEQGRFYIVRIPWQEDFEKFYATAREIIDNTPLDGDPYANEANVEGDDIYNVVLVSATPDLYFTSISVTLSRSNGNECPLINVGKVVTREGKMVMPVAINAHHGFVDGAHFTDFFARVERYLL